MVFNLKTIFSSVKKTSIVPVRKVVGIDFGSASVKVVELEMSEGIVTLSTYGELQLGPYEQASLGAAVQLPLQKQIEALVDVLRESSVSAKDGIFALPLAQSFVTMMTLASKPEEDIAPLVNAQARKYIPVPLTDVVLEWTEVPLPQTQGLAREILLVAIQSRSLSDIGSILDAINMTSRQPEMELFSTLRAVTKEQDKSLAVIDLGASLSKLYITQNGFLRRLHRTQYGGVYATNLIANQLKISFEDAETFKRTYAATQRDANIIKKGIEQTLELSLQEFKRVIDQYQSHTGTKIERIAITGGGALFAGTQQYASYIFDREVEIANPFTKIAFPAFLEDTLKNIAPSFTVALGAALRRFEQ